MAPSITVGTQNLTIGAGTFPNIAANSLNITWVLNGRSTCEFTVQSTSSYGPVVGEEVVVLDGSTRIFAGIIYGAPRAKRVGTSLFIFQVRCVDFNQILSRRSAGQYQWYGQNAGTIVTDICNNSLTDELVDTSLIQTGPVIDRFETLYPTVGEAIAAVANLANFHYYVDFNKKLRFFSPTTYTAPFVIEDPPDNVQSLEIEPTLDEYANSVLVRFPQFLLPEATEVFDSTGRSGVNPLEPAWAVDGSRTTFPMSFPIGASPTITVNGGPQTVGVNGVDTGKDWYWSTGSNDVTQDAGGAVLAGADILSVTYVGIDASALSASNATEIAARQAIEGGSGIYQKIFEAGDIFGNAAATQLVDSLLDKSDEIPAVANIQTNTHLEPLATTLKPGDVLNIDVSGYGAAADYLVRTIRIQDQRGATYLNVGIEAIKGPLVESATDFFNRISSGGASAGSITGGSSSGGGTTTPTVIGNVTAVSVAAPVPIVVDGATKATLTVTATAPVTASFGTGATEFAGVEVFIATPVAVFPLGWQRPTGIAAGTPFSFDLTVSYPSSSESWTIYLVARSEAFINDLVVSGAGITPNVMVAMVPLSLTAAPNVALYSAGHSNGDGTFAGNMYWDSLAKNMLIDWACIAPTDRSNWSGVQIWIKAPDGIGGYNYVPATGIIGIDAFTETSEGFVHYDTIALEPASIPVPVQNWDFIAGSAAADADQTLNKTSGIVTGPTITLTTLAKSDLVTGFSAAVTYENSEAGDQQFRLSGSWTNPVPPRYKGVRIIMRGFTASDIPLADEYEGSSSFHTDAWPVPSTSKSVTIYAVPIFGDNSIGVIVPGTTPAQALTIARQAGTTGIEFAPLVTGFTCGTPVYGLNGAGQMALFIDVTWTRPTAETFGGIILKMIRSSITYTLSGLEPNSPNRIEITDFPSASEVVTIYALSADTNNRLNSYQTSGANITPSASVTLPVPTRVATGSGFTVTYAYVKLPATGQIVLQITPAFTAPVGTNFGWFDFWAQREDSVWYLLGSPDQGGVPGMATLTTLPAVSFTWNFLLIAKDVNGKDRNGNASSNPASPPSGSLSTTKLINPPKTDVPLGNVTSFSVQYQYTDPDNNGSRQLLINPIFTPPADPTWAYVDFWAKREDGVWYLLGSPGAGSAFVGAIPGPGVATIAQLPAITFTWLFAAVCRNTNNQDLAGNYAITSPGTWPTGTATTSLSIAPPGLGTTGVERTSNVTFDSSFNGGVNPSTSFPVRADGSAGYQVFTKIILPTGDPTWAGFDVISMLEDPTTGLLDLTNPDQTVRVSGIKTVDAIVLLPIPATVVKLAFFFVSFDTSGRRNTVNATEMAIGGVLTPRKNITVGSITGLADLSKALTSTLAPAMAILGGQLDIAGLGVTTGKLANLAVTDAKINDLTAAKITTGTLIAGVTYTGTVNTNQINAGTISVAITLTAPTLVITGSGGLAGITVDINSSDGIKLRGTTGTGQFLQLSASTIRMDPGSGSVTSLGPSNLSFSNLSVIGLDFLTLRQSGGTVGFGVNTGTTYISGSATGGISSLPSNPSSFLIVTINGGTFKIPFYNN